MDPLKNPFAPGAGAPPPELVGRGPILEEARILLGRIKRKKPEKSMLLIFFKSGDIKLGIKLKTVQLLWKRFKIPPQLLSNASIKTFFELVLIDLFQVKKHFCEQWQNWDQDHILWEILQKF